MKYQFYLKFTSFLIFINLLVSCSQDALQSKISVKNIFNPDSVPPQFILVNAQNDIERLNHYTVRYDVIFKPSPSVTPAAGDADWQVCSENIGNHSISTVPVGTTVYDVYYKTGAVVEALPLTTISITRD